MTCSRAKTIDLEAFAVDPRAAEWAEFREHYPRCPDCSREVARLAAAIAALGSAAGSAHPTDEQLLAFSTSRESVSPEQRARIEGHLAGCAPCRTELAVLRDFDFAALGAEQWSFTARLLEAVRRLGVAFVPTLPKLALAAAAVALIAVSASLWRADSGGVVEEPRAARAEPEAPVEIAEEPAARAPAEQAAPAPSPEPAEPAPPRVQARIQAPAPQRASAATTKPQREPEPQAPARPPPAAAPEAPKRPVQIAALLPSEAPRYVPGALASDSSRRIGSVARSGTAGAAAPQVLAPPHVGRTSRASPTLYWFLREPTPLPVELTVVDPAGVEPLLEKTLPGPSAAGVHALRLAESGVRLAPGVDYPWFVTLVVDPGRRSNDLVSGASIRYEPGAAVSGVPPERLAHAEAEAGLWYDAFDQLSSWLAAEPGAALLHAHRAALLEQVGLEEVARYERGNE